MKEETFEDRLMEELGYLHNNIENLRKALKTKGFEEKVGKMQFDLLKTQLAYMEGYEYILHRRMCLLGIIGEA